MLLLSLLHRSFFRRPSGLLSVFGLRPSATAILFVCVVGALSTGKTATSQDEKERQPKSQLFAVGKQIYENQCAECHGNQGDGVDGAYDKPLHGVLGLPELTSYIAETMPEGSPEDCVSKDAESVAQYVFDTFYSLDARNRRNPPSILFSRLTSDQYQNAVSDLLSEPLGRREVSSRKPGLRGVYYSSRRSRRKDQVDDRVDSQVDFQFGEGAPDKVEGKEFSIRWSGSLVARETGEYTIIVQSANSVRLRLNGGRKPLVDANVVSGEKSEYKEQVHLMAGRLYDLQIDYSRHKEKTAFIQLSWVRPSGIEEVIPATQFDQQRSRPQFVSTARFPPDDQSYGYPRGLSVSREWTEALSRASLEAAQTVSRSLDPYVGNESNPKKRRERARKFCHQLAERAFRRGLSDDEKSRYVDSFFDAQLDTPEATKRSVLLILKSPWTVYVDLKPDQAKPAFYLALTLWDSLPDQQLRSLESKGELKLGPKLDSVVNQMLNDGRAKIKLRKFWAHWLKLNDLHGLEKDESAFPGFDRAIQDDLRQSLMRQLDEISWGETPDFRELFTTRRWLVNRRLAEFYGITFPKDAETGFVAVESAEPSAGILTHPYLMAGFSYTDSSSPIHRGVFIAQNVFGRRLNPPPDTFPPFDGEIAKTWTTREKVVHQTKPVSCQRCHSLINSLGFALENYDPIGRYRKTDNGKSVDASGHYRSLAGNLLKFDGPSELSAVIVADEAVHQHFVEELFQYLVKQPLAAFGIETRDRLMKEFRERNFNMKRLLVEIAKVAAFERPAIETGETTASNQSAKPSGSPNRGG